MPEGADVETHLSDLLISEREGTHGARYVLVRGGIIGSGSQMVGCHPRCHGIEGQWKLQHLR